MKRILSLLLLITLTLCACTSPEVPENVETGEELIATYNGKEYKTVEEFIYSYEGRFFQFTAYRAAHAFFTGNIEELRSYYFEEDFEEDLDYLIRFKDRTTEIEYMAFLISLRNFDSYGIEMDYLYATKGGDTFIYLTMVLALDENNEWKVRWMGLQG